MECMDILSQSRNDYNLATLLHFHFLCFKSKLQPNSNAAVVAQGFTVSEGLELNSASCLNESMTECVASLSNSNGEEDERTSVISDSDSHFLLNSLIVKSSPTHYSCAACLKRFQDLAILR